MEIKPFESKEIKSKEEMPFVPLSQLRRMINSLKDQPGDTKLTLVYILTAFFPSVWDNIVSYTNDCYMQGYLAGRKEALDADQRN